MKYATITNELSTDGKRYVQANHGHQLKDYFGGLAICKLFGLKYVHTSYEYLDFFTTNMHELPMDKLMDQDPDLKVISLSEVIKKNQVWGGHNYDLELFNRQLDRERLMEIPNDCILNIDNGSYQCKKGQGAKNMRVYRLHPCVARAWYEVGMLDWDIFDEIVSEFTDKFTKYHVNHKSQYDSDKINVAVHIGRGIDYTTSLRYIPSFVERYMFKLGYFEWIFNQLRKIFGKKLLFHIYTEKLNSEEVVDRFSKCSDVEIHVGSDRKERNHDLVHDIFYHFVTSDILIPCNSAFSVVATYYRKNKITIYHPHEHLYGLPMEHGYIPTDVNGLFDVDYLKKIWRVK
jgi:hypothetical protein